MDSTATIASQAGQWFGRASMKVLSDNTVVLVYREGSSHDVNDGELHIRFSDDYGQTWTAEDTYLDSNPVSGFPMNPTGKGASEDASEPWLYLADNGDLILHMWRVDYGVSNNGTYQSVSSDGGATWSASAAVDFTGIAGDNDIFATEDNFVVSGTIYAGARIYADVTPSNSKVIFIKSVDNGATWSYVSDITANNAYEVGLEFINNDTIIAMIRDFNKTNSYKRISTDMGATWGTLVDMTDQHVGIAGRQRVYTRNHIKRQANWWTDNVLIMIGFIHQISGIFVPRRNCIWISLDAGATWSFPFWIDTPVEDCGYGDIIYDPLNNQYVVVSYQGTQAEAILKQYNLTITGLP